MKPKESQATIRVATSECSLQSNYVAAVILRACHRDPLHLPLQLWTKHDIACYLLVDLGIAPAVEKGLMVLGEGCWSPRPIAGSENDWLFWWLSSTSDMEKVRVNSVLWVGEGLRSRFRAKVDVLMGKRMKKKSHGTKIGMWACVRYSI